MPLVRVHLRTGRTAAEKKAILDGLHAAFVEALKIPEADRNQLVQCQGAAPTQPRKGPPAGLARRGAMPGQEAGARISEAAGNGSCVAGVIHCNAWLERREI
jgi:hypothetical protein